jgi:hypothetical protein
MGGFQCAGTGKDKKSYRKFPLSNILARQKWPILIIIFVLSSLSIRELFKNSVRKKYFKKL